MLHLLTIYIVEDFKSIGSELVNSVKVYLGDLLCLASEFYSVVCILLIGNCSSILVITY